VNPAEFSTVLLYQGLTGLAENAGREKKDLKLRDEFLRQQDNAVCCVWKAKLVNLVTILLKFASNFCDRKHMHSVCSQRLVLSRIQCFDLHPARINLQLQPSLPFAVIHSKVL